MTSTSALPGTTILNLPVASQLDGTEWVPMVQGGTTVRSQSGEVSNVLSNVDLVLTSTAPPGYSNARQLAIQTGVTSLTDGGGSSQVVIGIATNGIGNAQIRQSAGLSVIGRGSSTTGNVADITGTSDQTLIVSSGGTTLGFGQLNLASSNAVTGVLGAGFGGTGNSALSPYQIIAAGTASSGAFQSVTAGTSGYVLTYVSSTSLPVWQSIPGFTQATAGNIANYTSSNSVGGNSYANISSATVTIGVASSLTGNLALASSIGGTTIITPSSASPTITLPQATTTLIGRDTVDTLTGKTFNTASSSNHLLINGTSVTAVTGGGNTVVLNSTPSISSAAIAGGQLSAISSFGLRTTAASFDLVLGSTETLTASRNLNIRVGDANRNLVLTGDLTLATSYALSYTLTNTSSLTLPTSGTLATIANTETFTNKTIATGNNTIQVGATTLSTISDLLNTLGSSQGQILYKGAAAAWVALTVGSSTQVLLGGTTPQWGSLSGTGTVTAVTGGTGIVTSPSTITSSGTISLASISNNSVLGNVSGGSATPSSLSGAQVATLLTAPTRQFFASGAGTYTITSTAVKYIVVKMIGGGGGGAGSGTVPGAATNGSATTFGSSIFSAGGGNAGSGAAGGSGGTASSTASIFTVGGGNGANGGGVTTSNPGGAGGVSFFGGSGLGGAAGAGAGTAAIANSGSGGGGGGVNTTANGGGGGGAGAYIEGFITSPSSTYAYSVGAGGSAGTAGGSGAAGGAGGSGQIVVYEYYQ